MPLLFACLTGFPGHSVQAFGNHSHRSAGCMVLTFQKRISTDVCKPEIRDIEEELILFEKNVGPPSIESCISLLQKCKTQKNLDYAKRVYKHICGCRLEAHRKLGSYIVAMFAECGSMINAQQAFDRLDFRNDYSWFSLLQGYNHCGEFEKALEYLPKLKKDCFSPSTYTFQALLKACGRLKCKRSGQEIHAEITKEELDRDPFTGSNLVDMYVKCGMLKEAQDVFDGFINHDVVLWTALIEGYADHGFKSEVFRCLFQMRREGVSPNPVTFVCGLKGCERISQVRKLHMEIVKEGFEVDSVLGNTLVDIYAKRGSLAEASKIFSELFVQGVVSWTALINGHVEHGIDDEALHLFEKMEDMGVVPDIFVFVSALKACGNVGAAERALKIHCQILKLGYESESFVGNALVDMYGKCGLLLEARKVFNKLLVHDVVIWSALITACASEGETMLVHESFEMMLRKEIQPDRIVLLAILTSCAHAGLVDLGNMYLGTMRKDHGILQTIEHYNSVIDVLGRAGQLHKAVLMLEAMPVQPNLVTWVTLLGACRNQGNRDLGRKAFKCALKLQGKHSGSLLLAMQM